MKTATLDKLSFDVNHNFIIFSLYSWLIFGFILFLSGFGHQSFLSTLVRNGLLVPVGFSLSFLLRSAYHSLWNKYSSLLISGVAVGLLSFLCGVLTGLILNPITFFGFHGGMGEEPYFALFAGVLNFTFVYVIWSVIYLIRKFNSNRSQENTESNYVKRIPIDLSERILLINTSDITHIQSDSDYVKIYSKDKSYLLRKSLSNLEKGLDPCDFQRIHRSTIVNLNFIESLKPHMNGEYFIILKDGTSLKLSRSYKHVIKDHIGGLNQIALH